MYTNSVSRPGCYRKGLPGVGTAAGIVALGLLLFLLLLTASSIRGLAMASEVHLATVHPGPYALVADWGIAEETEIELTWGAFSQIITAQPGWQSIILPSGITPLHFPLTWRSKSSLQPRMLLYAKGDPLELIPTRNGLEPRALADPAPSQSDDAMSFALPGMTPDLYVVSLAMSNATENESGCVADIAVGASHTQTVVAENQTVVAVVNALPSSSSEPSVITAQQHGESCPAISSLRIQPLYLTLECLPFQTGVYYFETFDEQGRPLGPIARLLQSGLPAQVHSEGALIGRTASFFSQSHELVSAMSDDITILFDGFHVREPSSTSPPYPPFQRWTASSEARIILRLPPETDAEIALRLLTSCPKEVLPRDALLTVEGENLNLLFENGLWEGRILVPAAKRTSETITVRISSRLWKPSEVLDSTDDRHLGLLLDRLSVVLHSVGSANVGAAPAPRF